MVGRWPPTCGLHCADDDDDEENHHDVVVVDDIEAINIDRHIDFDFAELISKKYKLK